MLFNKEEDIKGIDQKIKCLSAAKSGESCNYLV